MLQKEDFSQRYVYLAWLQIHTTGRGSVLLEAKLMVILRISLEARTTHRYRWLAVNFTLTDGHFQKCYQGVR